MSHEHVEERVRPESLEDLAPRLRAYLMNIPEVRLAYYQPGPSEEQLVLHGPDRARVILVFTRAVSGEQIEKRLTRMQRNFAATFGDLVELVNIESLDRREACEAAFNAHLAYGSAEAGERDRLYRYNVFLDWNAGRRMSGAKQEAPPALLPTFERAARQLSLPQFITPLYRHLKLIEAHLREMRPLAQLEPNAFTEDAAVRAQAETSVLKSIQSAILVTMSIIHRRMRLTARDYRDLFLHLPVFGIASRERARKLAHCAEIRDRLLFEYSEVSATEVYEYTLEVLEVMQDFKAYMLDWLFEHCYGPSGELLQTE